MIKKNKTNWKVYIADAQLILLAMMLTNSVNVMGDEFSWLGLGVILSCLAFVMLTLYLKNTRFAT
jgi:hypothetical protein